MNLSPEKQKNLACAVLGVVIVIFGFWYLGIQGLHAKQKRDIKEVARLKEENIKQQQAIQKEKRDRETAVSYRVYIASLENQMPKGNKETWLVKELSDLAVRHNLQLSNTMVQPLTEQSNLKFKGHPYKLEGFRFLFNGELNQIGKFLEDMENNIPLMEVDELAITAGSALAPHVHTVSISISMVVKS